MYKNVLMKLLLFGGGCCFGCFCFCFCLVFYGYCGVVFVAFLGGGVGWGGMFALFLLVLFYLTLWYNKITKQFRKLKDIKTVLKHNKVNEMV